MSTNSPERNPYDFVMPVANVKAFADRDSELRDIEYYLDQTKQGLYVNLAFVGPRASGKTSLLNMLGVKARERGFLVVKIDLDADMVGNELLFFQNLFDSIVSNGAERGMLGGIADTRFETFRRQIDMADTTTNPVNETLRFGRLYAASVSESKTIPISQTLLKHDFSKLVEEATIANIPTIVVLFDECDLFSKNEALLQKLRNVFAEVRGYLLGFAGTERMFPVLNEVFSPIPRQFKKISVLPFHDEADTRSCIISPARAANVPVPWAEPSLVLELHALSGGSPYEIQLLCHFMFRRRDPNQPAELKLNIEVLDDVLNELERPQADAEKQFAQKVKGLSHTLLNKASALLAGDGLATREDALWQLALSDYSSDELEAKESSINQLRKCFEELGLIRITGDRFEFEPKAFGKLYLKYFYHAVKRDTTLPAIPPGAGEYYSLIVQKLRRMIGNECLKPACADGTNWQAFHRVVPITSGCKEAESFRCLVDSRDLRGLVRNDLYFPLVVLPSHVPGKATDTFIVEIQVSVWDVTHVRIYFVCSQPLGFAVSQLDAGLVKGFLDERSGVLAKYGVAVREVSQCLMPAELIVRAIKLDEVLQRVVHMQDEMREEFGAGNLEKARKMAVEIIELAEPLSAQDLADHEGNLGFINMCLGNLDEALSLMQSSLSKNDSPIRRVNLAYIMGRVGNYAKAEEAAGAAIDLCKDRPGEEASFLKIFFGNQDPLVQPEAGYDLVTDPNIMAAALCTQAVLGATKRDFEDALRCCDSARRLEPSRAFPLRTLARVHLMNGSRAEALQSLQLASRLEPDDRWVSAERQLLFPQGGDAQG